MNGRHPDHNPMIIGAVFLGGVAGALVRLALSESLPHDLGSWPWATFVANISGTFLLGYAATILLERPQPATRAMRLVGTGFCGALTTFSTLQLELVRIFERGDATLAITYATVSIAVGLGAVIIGTRLARNRAGALE